MLLSGVHAPLPTPIGDDETVDPHALRRMLDWLIACGVDGVAVLGTLGEFFALAEPERERVVAETAQHAAGRVQVIVGISSCSTREAIAAGRRASAVGADAVMVVPPWYYPATDAELKAHFRAIAASVDLPIIVYNNAFATGGDVPIDVLVELAETESNIRYCKETSYNAARIGQLNQLTDKLTVLAGTDGLRMESYVAGAGGCILGTALLSPANSVALFSAVQGKRWDEAFAINRELIPLSNYLERSGRFIALAKAGVSLRGVAIGEPIPPCAPATEEERISLSRVLPIDDAPDP